MSYYRFVQSFPAGAVVLTTILAASASPTRASAQRPLNLDFEIPGTSGPDRPWGWSLGWSAFAGGSAATFALDSLVRRQGRRSLRIARGDSATGDPPSIVLQLPADFARGRALRLTGWIRTERLQRRALLTLEAWKDREFAAADTVTVTPAAAPAKWTRYELTLRVPAEQAVHSVVVTASLEGSGTAWFDDLELRVDGAPITALPPTIDAPSPAGLSWLAGHATLLRDVRVIPADSVDDADLGRFADLVGEARIVALGESTHGTREFFLVKHRLLEYLVRRAGFTLFAIEANQLAVEKVNRYVQGGSGTAKDVMRTMFRVWNTEEMLALVDWMRTYNAAHPDRMVQFVGYDMQDHRTPADSLRAFLARAEPVMLPRFDVLAGEYRAQSTSATPQIPDSTRGRWRRQADLLWKEVSEGRPAWLTGAANRKDTLVIEWAVQAANLLRQAATFNVTLNSPARDSLMASNLEWILTTQAPGARAVVWAHDVHVSRGGDSALSFNQGAQMGAYLSRRYDQKYRALSLLTYSGVYSATRSFTDHRMIAAPAFPAPTGSLEAALHQLKRPPTSVGWVVDLRPARTDPGGAWLQRPRPIRHIGFAAYDYGFELSAVLPLEFDGVVFIDHTTPSRLLP